MVPRISQHTDFVAFVIRDGSNFCRTDLLTACDTGLGACSLIVQPAGTPEGGWQRLTFDKFQREPFASKVFLVF